MCPGTVLRTGDLKTKMPSCLVEAPSLVEETEMLTITVIW